MAVWARLADLLPALLRFLREWRGKRRQKKCRLHLCRLEWLESLPWDSASAWEGVLEYQDTVHAGVGRDFAGAERAWRGLLDLIRERPPEAMSRPAGVIPDRLRRPLLDARTLFFRVMPADFTVIPPENVLSLLERRVLWEREIDRTLAARLRPGGAPATPMPGGLAEPRKRLLRRLELMASAGVWKREPVLARYDAGIGRIRRIIGKGGPLEAAARKELRRRFGSGASWLTVAAVDAHYYRLLEALHDDGFWSEAIEMYWRESGFGGEMRTALAEDLENDSRRKGDIQ